MTPPVRQKTLGTLFALVICAGMLVSCATYQGRQPLAEHPADRSRRVPPATPQYHTISRGETLFSIAWRYGVDYRQIAALNGLYEPYRIYAGRRLLLRRMQRNPESAPTNTRQAQAWERDQNVRGGDEADRAETGSAAATRTPVAGGSRRIASGVAWNWPVRGQVSVSAPDSDKVGVEIRGAEGTIIRAAAPGEVVYSGDRLIGYGKLIIIRHNDAFLSAYGHNRRLLVTEGLKVAAGQQIAEMGSSGTDQSKLYFEIRRHGKPVPPLDYLP